MILCWQIRHKSSIFLEKFNKNANFYHNFAKIAKKYLGLQMDKKASQNPHLKPKKQAKKQKNAPKVSKDGDKIQKNSSQVPKKQSQKTKDESKLAKIQGKAQEIQGKNKKKQSKGDKIQNKDKKIQSKVLKIQSEKIQAKSKTHKGKSALKASESEVLQPKMTPKFLARQEKIKKVALNLFLTQGYEETSLKEIIKKSGGSFSDIYSTFQNKEGLFVGVINDILTAKREIYSKILNKNLPLREFLYEFSTSVMRMFLQKRALRLVKIIYSQLYKQSNRALIEHFKQNKENIPEQTLVKYFANCPPPLCDEAQRYAELFFNMLKGKCLEEAFFFDKPLMSKKEQAEHCEFVVNFFIKALSAQAKALS